MAKNHLTNDDQCFIDNFNEQYNAIIDTLNNIKQFQLHDYLVLYIDNNATMTLQRNSYGAPIKYQVVYVNKSGIPFIKQVNKEGKPIGRIFSCAGTEGDTYRGLSEKFEFALDPDYADSILLQDEYDPSNLHRSKKDIWKAVTDHNKACKVKTFDLKDIIHLFSDVNIGDMLWTSNVSYFLVQDKKLINPKDFNSSVKLRYRTSIRGTVVTILTVLDKSGKVKDVCPDFFAVRLSIKRDPEPTKNSISESIILHRRIS